VPAFYLDANYILTISKYACKRTKVKNGFDIETIFIDEAKNRFSFD